MKTINYSDYKSTLKEVSLDSSQGVAMCDSEIEIIHFDKFLQDYFKSFNESSKPPESVDGY